jgi:hypothetical protein
MAAAWTPDQRARWAEAQAGFCVVANMHRNRDQALIAWARGTRRFIRIDGATEWRNPFLTPDDGDWDEVVGKFATLYLPHKTALLAQINSGALRGKVLGCWCHPRLCHGHILAERANGLAAEYARPCRVAAVHPDPAADTWKIRIE